MKTLIVAEKPSAAEDYKNALESKLGKFTKGSKRERYYENDTTVITWARGHLLKSLMPKDYKEFTERPNKGWDLSTIPFYPPNGQLDYVVHEEDIFKAVTAVMERTDISTVINACDPGREGELIFWEMYDYLKLKKPVKRLWCPSLTDNEIRKEYDNLKGESFCLPRKDAAYARAYADWMLGMNLTIGFTVKANMGGGKALHMGRVQTPTIAILVKRKLEIDNFKPEDYFEVEAEFGGKYKGMWFKNQLSQTKFDKKEEAENLVAKIKGKQGTIVKKDVKEEQEHHPFLYSLTSLQQDANKKFGYTADETLKLAQSLYETHKILSYPRSDSEYLGKDHIGKLQPTLQAVNVSNYQPFVTEIIANGIKTTKRFVDDTKLTDHHALIPTEKTPNLGALSVQEKKIYDLVVKRFLSVFYPSAKYEKTEIVTEVEGEKFKTSGKIELSPGWKVVYGTDTQSDEEDKKGEKEQKLPIINKDETNPVSSHKLHSKKTKSPKHYTESELLGAMKNPKKFLADKELQDALTETEAGLGTTATRAALIENIISRGYVERVKKNIIATELGMQLVEVCPEELKSPEITAEWEQKLLYIQEEKLTKTQFQQEIHDFVERNIVKLREQELSVTFKREEPQGEVVGKCPGCGESVFERAINVKDPKSGKVKAITLYVCSSSTKEVPCFRLYNEMNGKKLPQKAIKQLIEKGKSDEIAGFKGKTGKLFSAALIYKDKKIMFDFPEQTNIETTIVCPICQKNMMDKGNSIACEAGHLTVYKTIASKTLTIEQIELLIKTGETPVIEGFKSKAGNLFSAKLKRTADKIEFDFTDVPSQGKSSGLSCPICSKGSINELAWGYGCSNFKEGCKFSIGKEMFGKKISMAIVKELAMKKKTSKKIDGFKSKAGKEYSAYLVYDENEKRVKVSFE